MRRTSLLFAAIATLVPAAHAQEYLHGVDEFTAGSYNNRTRGIYGVNAPGVTVYPEEDQWPRLVLLYGLYNRMYFGARGADYPGLVGAKKVFESFGRIVPDLSAASVKRQLRRVDWSGVTCRYTWGRDAESSMDLLVTNLFPGVRLTANSDELLLFNGTGKAPPSYAALATSTGIRIQKTSVADESAMVAPAELDISSMSEPWILLWFADSPGFKDLTRGNGEEALWIEPLVGFADIMYGSGEEPYHGADCPWLIVLQHKPTAVSIGSDGVKLKAESKLGDVGALPLFGRILQRPEETRRWAHGLPKDVLERVRFWSRVSRALPIGCKEDFSYEKENGKVSIRNRFTYRFTEDDWQTEPLKVAPVPPTVGICRLYNDIYRFPLFFEQDVLDTGYLAQWGPYYCVPNSDTLVYGMDGLNRYLSEVLEIKPAHSEISQKVLSDLDDQVRALTSLDRTMNRATWQPCENGAIFIFTKPEQVAAVARTLPLLSDELRQETKDFLEYQVLSDLLNRANWTFRGTAYGKPVAEYHGEEGHLTAKDYGTLRVLYALWAYAYYTNDWETITKNWDLIESALVSLVPDHTWASCLQGEGHVAHRLNIAINGLIGCVRMARENEDGLCEARAAYLLAKSLLAWYAQWKAANYDQLCEPREDRWHSLAVYRQLYGDLIPKIQSTTGQFLGSRTQSWRPHQGFKWCSDPTLFNSPMSIPFLEASPELLRFYEDYFKTDVSDQFDYVTWIWPLIFSNEFCYQTGIQWGFACPYFRVAAFVKREKPEQLLKWLPDAHFADEPFYLENLLAVLYAQGNGKWVRIQEHNGQ